MKKRKLKESSSGSNDSKKSTEISKESLKKSLKSVEMNPKPKKQSTLLFQTPLKIIKEDEEEFSNGVSFLMNNRVHPIKIENRHNFNFEEFDFCGKGEIQRSRRLSKKQVLR